MEDASKRRFDVVLCWKLDRFGRSLLNFISALDQLKAHGVRFIVSSQGIDTDESTPTARLFQHMLMAFAEFERELIRERVAAGLKRYRQDYSAGKVGKETHSRSGKDLAVGRPKRIFDRDRVRQLRSQGLSPRQIARAMHVGEGTVRRVLRGGSDATEARQNVGAGIV
jgi:DNA invertase Pin-like site-specific DNA recombinase